MSPVFCPCFTDGAACRLMSDEVSTYSLFATCTPGILNITLRNFKGNILTHNKSFGTTYIKMGRLG